MKKQFLVFFLFQIALFACNSKTSKKAESEKPNLTSTQQAEVSEMNKGTETEIDTSKIKRFAEQILENKVEPSDNDETFETINQLFAENEKDLEFYFEVFRTIAKKSDGALSEIIGQYLINFLKFNPDFFLEKYSEFDSEEKNRFVGFMAYEFYFAETDYSTEIDGLFNTVENGLKSKSEVNLKMLTSMKESVTKETEKIIAE